MKEIADLPPELFDHIFGLLYSHELRQLRLVSRNWLELCRRLIWREVVVDPQDNWGASYYKYPEELSYRQIQELGTNGYFRNELSNTQAIHVRYGHGIHVRYGHAQDNTDDECIRAFHTMPSLFENVQRVTVAYDYVTLDSRFVEFQRMLDGWKPKATFHLHLTTEYPTGNRAYINIDGMSIKELHISSGIERIPEEIPALPLSRTKRNVPVKLTDLRNISNDLTILVIYTDYDMSGYIQVPETVKELRLANNSGNYSTDSKIIVPSGLELLDIHDIFVDNSRSAYTFSSEILDTLDLSGCSQIKEIIYRSWFDVSMELVSAILLVRETLEYLKIRCRAVAAESAFDFKSLALAGLCLKQMDISVEVIGRQDTDYDNFTCNFPELELLTLYLHDPENEEKWIDILVTKFLQGCPKLGRMELRSNGALSRCGMDINREELFIVDISGAKAVLISCTQYEAKSP